MSCLPLPGVPWGTRRWCLGRRHSRARLKLRALGGTGPLVLLVQPYQGPVRLPPHLAPASTVLSGFAALHRDHVAELHLPARHPAQYAISIVVRLCLMADLKTGRFRPVTQSAITLARIQRAWTQGRDLILWGRSQGARGPEARGKL